MSEAQKTLETIERMFVYLGCANIATRSAMDFTVPIGEIGTSAADDVIAETRMESLELLGPIWDMKVCYFHQDNLALSTVKNVHWSTVYQWLEKTHRTMRIMGKCGHQVLTANADCFINLHYSEIDKFGNFVKFPVNHFYHGTARLLVKKLYNPGFTLAFRDEHLCYLGGDSSKLFQSNKLMFLAEFLPGLAQSLPHYWFADTQYDPLAPSLRLLTDATGIKELWKLRDIPEGKKRRAALLHWVADHWRKDRNDPEVELYVRTHMRGQTQITQGNFKVAVKPSERDKLKLALAKRDREELRRKKLDRRKRRRLLEKI